MSDSRRRRRPLTKTEIELWMRVTADVRPFRRQPEPIEAKPALETVAAPEGAAESPRKAQALERPAAPRSAPAVSDLDQKTRLKLRRGRIEVDARLDLHGMRQHEAQRALCDFLYRCQRGGGKVAIVITGKGSTGEGVLRRLAPLWLQAPHLRDVVSGFGEAARQHGGEGALYVRIRRLRGGGS